MRPDSVPRAAGPSSAGSEPEPTTPMGRVGVSASRSGGSAASFESVFKASSADLYRLAWALCWDNSTAEDIVQTAFCDAYANWDEVSKLRRPDLWLKRMVVNRCSNARRNRLRDSERIKRVIRLARGGHSAAGSDPQIDRDSMGFLELVADLPTLQRNVIALHYLDDVAVADIAEVLGVTEGTVKTSLSRGRATLADRLRPPADGSAQPSTGGPAIHRTDRTTKTAAQETAARETTTRTTTQTNPDAEA